MRRTIGKTLSLRHFSTGRGRGVSPVTGKFTADHDDVTSDKPALGHGRGTTINPPPLSSLGRGSAKNVDFLKTEKKTDFLVKNGQKSDSVGENGAENGSFGGNGDIVAKKVALFVENDKKAGSNVLSAKKPVSGDFSAKNEDLSAENTVSGDLGAKKAVDENIGTKMDIHLGIVSALSGIGRGRGKSVNESRPLDRKMENLGLGVLPGGVGRGKNESGPLDRKIGESRVVESNRHIRAKNVVSDNQNDNNKDINREKEKGPKLSREDAVRKALGILSVGDGVGMGDSVGDGMGTGERRMDSGGRGTRGGFRGRGGRGRGRGRGRFDGGRGRGRGRDSRDQDDDAGSGLYLGDEADGEKLAKTLGPEKMDMLAEAFDEMSGRVLPSPIEDTYIDALHTNMMIECEPEYLMEDFGTNPDIDDTPPIPLRDALEKSKPFLMAYENIQSHEEWEKVIEETMKNVPLMKEIVDHYSGPDRVTAKQQQKELRRVADTLPDRAHASVKRFTDRAILSLQSNPGWGFDKKCQFMDKLAREVSQHYK